MKKLVALIILSFFCAILFGHAGNAIRATENGKPAWKLQQKEGEKAYDLSTILVKFKEGVTQQKRKGLAKLVRGKFKDKNEDGINDHYQNIMGGRLALIKLEGVKGKDLAAPALLAMQNHPLVEYAEHNYLHSIDLPTPNDLHVELWGLHNEGQTGGTLDADIDAPEAWDITTGRSEVIVGVIDTGVDYNHVDLAANMWTNLDEIPGNHVDDDENGYVDDVHGINAINDSGDPIDDHGHGTHCSGTIGAVGDNGIGVVGVNWDIQIMALKFLDADGYGSDANAIKCINYAVEQKNKGVNIGVLSNSWGGGGFSQGLLDAINYADGVGILFVASAGNDGSDNDSSPHYPSSYEAPNVMAVGSTDHNDNRSSFSNYGATSVDLFAPGSSILSTLPGNDYGTKSGTSMAAPHVSGVAALMLSELPENIDLSASKLKDILMNSADLIPALSDFCVSGKRLNAYNSLPPLWLLADPTSQTITQGGIATYTINVESAEASPGDVALSYISDPAIDATITLNPDSGIPDTLDPDSGISKFFSEMRVTTTTDTNPGDYIITVTGDDIKNTSVSLTVNPEGLITEIYSSDDTPAPIPDCKFPEDLPDSPGIITSTINVPDSLTIWDTTCEVHITHTWKGDLIVKLKSPAGTDVILHNREGGSDNNINETYVLPTEFRNQNSVGNWTLEVSDNMWDDVGTLDSWTLTIGGIPAGPVNQAPTVTITAPADSSTFTEGESVTFTGTADDPESSNISGVIVWDSNIDGNIGTGASVTTSALSAGIQIIKAEATDSDGKSGSDSITVTVNELVCNNDNICDPGEDCNNCPTDCTGEQGGGTCAACFKGKCDGSCNPRKEGADCADCSPSYCCGDGSCDPGENSCTCSVDCGSPPATEDGRCADGVDNDCDGAIDCDDSDCNNDPACSQEECRPRGEVCSDNSECCSDRCFRGKCK